MRTARHWTSALTRSAYVKVSLYEDCKRLDKSIDKKCICKGKLI